MVDIDQVAATLVHTHTYWTRSLAACMIMVCISSHILTFMATVDIDQDMMITLICVSHTLGLPIMLISVRAARDARGVADNLRLLRACVWCVF